MTVCAALKIINFWYFKLGMSAMTFTMSPNKLISGVRSTETESRWGRLCTENVAMVRVVFHYERFESLRSVINNILGNAAFPYPERVHGAGFWLVNVKS